MESGELTSKQEYNLKWAANNMYGAGNDTVSLRPPLCLFRVVS
jgi:hypothetical protein